MRLATALLLGGFLVGSAAPALAQQATEEEEATERTVLLCDEGERAGIWEDRWEIQGDRITFMRGDKRAGSAIFERLPDYLRANLEGAEIWLNRYTLRAYIAEKNEQGLMLSRTLDCRILDLQL
jgi:hypothetical protein